MRAEVVLSLQDLTIHYGDFLAVDALSLDVRRGEILGLLGPNGSGKSSALSAISGLLSPSAGLIRLLGMDPLQQPNDYRRRFGLVPQELAIFDELTGEENLRFFGRMYGLSGRQLRHQVQNALSFVQLSERATHRAGAYSGGMQRRLNLACALLHQPDLLLLDEPTVGLDIQSRDAIFASLRSLRDAGRAVIFTTHHLEEAEQLCDRIAIMQQGRLRALGDLADLRALVEGPSPAAIQTHPPQGVLRPVAAGRGIPASQPTSPPTWTYVTEDACPANLEQVYLRLTGRSTEPS